MARRSKEDSMVSEDGNWNVAGDFVREKIMKPLIKCDLYEDIAEKGYDSIAEEIYNWNLPPDDVLKIKGFNWLISELIRLIYNSKFALKKHGTKKEILKYKDQLEKIQKAFPSLISVKYNHLEKTKTVCIANKVAYEQFVETVKKIKSKINEPLNKNNLIFYSIEEFDAVAYKKEIFDNAISRG